MRRRIVQLVAILVVAWGGLALTWSAGIRPVLGLDLRGGVSVLLTAPEGTDPEVLDKAVDIMRRRIEGVGNVQEPEISISGDRNVLVQLPGVEDQERALQAIGTTGKLSFRPVLEVLPPGWTQGLDPEQIPDGVDPQTGISIEDDPTGESWLPERGPDGEIVRIYHVGPAMLEGSDVADAQAVFGGSSGTASGWVVLLDLTSEGAEKFAEATKQLARQPLGSPTREMAIVLDGEVLVAPEIAASVDPNVGITGGSAQITLGGADQEEALDLAVVLRYGALPVEFERAAVQKVSATLGEDSLRAGIAAGLLGLALVALYMLFYYRAFGLVTVVGVTVFGSLLITVFSLLGQLRGTTLTLAGVVGIVVSVGITADSYIVYFERIKEEVHKGRSVRGAVGEAFKAAFRTILTADFVSLLGAFLLWALAIGPVKGFALSLGIATALDVVVAYFFTRNAVALLAETPLADRGPLSMERASGLARKAEVPA